MDDLEAPAAAASLSLDAMPTDELLAAIIDERGLRLTVDDLSEARDFLVRFHSELETLRSVVLSYLPPSIEPHAAVRWIENGGRSPSTS